MLVGGLVGYDGVDHLSGWHGLFDVIQEGRKLLVKGPGAPRPRTVFRAANSAVVPLRTQSCV